MARFTLPRDVYHGKGALENLKALKGKKAVIVVGGGSMKRFGFLDKAENYLKEAGFEVMDKIQVYVKDNKVIEDIMKAHAEEIQAEVLAEKLLTDTAQGYVKSWNINSQEVTLGVEKMN